MKPKPGKKPFKNASSDGAPKPDPKWPPLKTEIKQLDPRGLKHQAKNARYMPPAEFARLVENVRIDGKLTSAPLACIEGKGLELLSGHHRTLAAIEAALPAIDVIVITSQLTPERKRAIQLAHNAIVGRDDPNTLAELYRGLGIGAKMFSGLTDAVLDVEKLTVSGFQAGIEYEQLSIQFLPDDRRAFEQALRRIGTAETGSRHVARYADFNAIFDAMVAVKEKRQVRNSALALAVMAELALERLDEIEAKQSSQATASTPAAAKVEASAPPATRPRQAKRQASPQPRPTPSTPFRKA